MFNREKGKYEGYIYVIDCAVSPKRYIGQTIQTIEMRWKQHCSDTRNKEDNMYIHHAMNKYGIDNFKMDIVEHVYADSENELKNSLNDKQVYYIKKYDTLVPHGYNLTRGGSYYSERYRTPVDCYDINGNKLYSFKSAAEACDYLGMSRSNGSDIKAVCSGKSKTCLGKVFRFKDEPFDKFDVSSLTEKDLSYRHRKKVKQYTEDGTLVNVYDSLREASIAVGAGSSGGTLISKCCKGKCYMGYNFVWRFEDSDFLAYTKDDFVDKKHRKIDKYTLDGDFLETYDNYSEAVASLGNENATYKTQMGRIYSCCIGKSQSYLGYKWSYHNKPISHKKYKRFVPHINSKKVDQYDLDGNFIKTYNSISEAVNNNGMKGGAGIIACCRHTSYQSGGYGWEYHGTKHTVHSKYKIGKRAVDQYDSNMKLLHTYSSLVEAAKGVGLKDATTILKCCQGEERTAKGYYWAYNGEDLKIPDKKRGRSRRVNCYTDDGIFLNAYDSIKDVVADLGATNPKSAADTIWKVCRGDRKHYAKCRWYFAEDPNQPDKSKIITD